LTLVKHTDSRQTHSLVREDLHKDYDHLALAKHIDSRQTHNLVREDLHKDYDRKGSDELPVTRQS
jgi:hypothetical protein